MSSAKFRSTKLLLAALFGVIGAGTSSARGPLDAAAGLVTLPASTPVAEAGRGLAPARLQDILGGIPAYAMELNVATFAQSYAAFDVVAPTTSTTIGAVPAGTPKTGTFVNYDFSRQYLIGADNALVSADTTTGASTTIGSAEPTVPDEFWTGMKWDPQTGNVYASACSPTGTGCHLYTIDPVSAAVNLVAPIGSTTADWFPMELAIDSQGRLFAINIVEPLDNYLVRIDKTSGAVTPIGATGINAIYQQGLDFDKATDTLYWPAFGQLGPGGSFQGHMYTVDTASGAVSLVGVLPNGGSEIWAFSIATAPAAVIDVPAYALELNISTFAHQYASLNAVEPGTSQRIGAEPAGSPATATFIGNDFSRQYMIGAGNLLVAVSTTDATVTTIGTAAPIEPSEFWTGMRWDPVTGNVYASACSSTGSGCHLYTIHPVTAAVTLVAPIGGGSPDWFPMELAIDSQGIIYSVNIVEPLDNYLVRIDKQSGAVTSIGPTGIGAIYLQGLDFDRRSDTLYWPAFGQLGPGGSFQGQMYTINTATGAVTSVGTLPNGGSEIWAFSIAAPSPANDIIFASGFDSP